MRRRAFTLTEVLLALALLTLLSGSMLSFIFGLMERRDRFAVMFASEDAADALLERLEADLLTAIAGDARAGSGFKGSASELALLVRGVRLEPGGDDERSAAPADLQSVRYAFESGSGLVRIWRGAAGASGGEPDELGPPFQRLRLRYHDGRGWRSSFDAAAVGRLPAAVDVAVWFAAPVRSEPDDASAGVADGADAAAVLESASPVESERTDAQVSRREPDRRRIIVIADAPEAGWSAGAQDLAGAARSGGGGR